MKKAIDIIFRKENLKKTIFTLSYLILGLLFCVLLSRMFNFVEFVFCYILLASGIICIVIYSLVQSSDKNFRTLILGIVMLLFGFFMILWPRFFGITLSALICYSGVSLIISGLKRKQNKDNSWITEFVVGVVVTALAIATAILSGTNVAKNLLSVFFGILLLINGGFGLAELVGIIKNENDKPNTEPSIEEKMGDRENLEEIEVEFEIKENTETDKN